MVDFGQGEGRNYPKRWKKPFGWCKKPVEKIMVDELYLSINWWVYRISSKPTTVVTKVATKLTTGVIILPTQGTIFSGKSRKTTICIVCLIPLKWVMIRVTKTSWWLNQPNWIISPIFGVKIPNIFELPPPSKLPPMLKLRKQPTNAAACSKKRRKCRDLKRRGTKGSMQINRELP